jgi:hypothetical protein
MRAMICMLHVVSVLLTATGTMVADVELRIELVPMVFFAEGSAVVDEHYRLREPCAGWRPDTLARHDPRVVHHAVLNLFGRYLVDHPDAQAELDGTFQDDGTEERRLAQARAAAVRGYLVDVWKIDQRRIDIRGTGFPRDRIDGVSDVRRAANRRVELAVSNGVPWWRVVLRDRTDGRLERVDEWITHMPAVRYPEPEHREVIEHFRRRAMRLGADISVHTFTGPDFSLDDEARRTERGSMTHQLLFDRWPERRHDALVDGSIDFGTDGAEYFYARAVRMRAIVWPMRMTTLPISGTIVFDRDSDTIPARYGAQIPCPRGDGPPLYAWMDRAGIDQLLETSPRDVVLKVTGVASLDEQRDAPSGVDRRRAHAVVAWMHDRYPSLDDELLDVRAASESRGGRRYNPYDSLLAALDRCVRISMPEAVDTMLVRHRQAEPSGALVTHRFVFCHFAPDMAALMPAHRRMLDEMTMIVRPQDSIVVRGFHRRMGDHMPRVLERRMQAVTPRVGRIATSVHTDIDTTVHWPEEAMFLHRVEVDIIVNE